MRGREACLQALPRPLPVGVAGHNRRPLRQLSDAASAEIELPELLQAVVPTVARMTHAPAGSIRVLRGQELTIGLCWGYKHPERRNHSIALDPLLTPLVRSQQCLVAADLIRDERVSKSRRERMEAEGLHAVACVPIIQCGDTVGVLALYGSDPRPWQDEELALFAAIAAAVAPGLANARHHQETHLREQRLRTVVSALPQPVIAVEPGGSICHASRAAEKLLGGKRLVGVPFDTLVAPADRDSPWHACLLRAVRDERHSLEWEGRLQSVCGAPLRVRVHVGVPEESPKMQPVVVTLTDLRCEQERLSRLVRSERVGAVQDVVSGLAHDINNTLTPIIGGVELGMRHPDRHPPERLLKTILDEALALSQRLRRLSTAVASGRGGRGSSMEGGEPCRLGDSVAAEVQLLQCDPKLQRTPARPGHSVAFAAGDSPESLCGIRRDELAQLVRQLVWNAVEAMPGGGCVNVSTEADDRWCRLLVADEGCGLPASQRQRAFDPYVTTDTERGRGLGLTLCRTIAERHQGRLRLAPNKPCGTVAIVEFPRAADGACGVPEKARGESRLSLLAVTGDAAVAHQVREVAQQLGAGARHALSQQEARTLVRDESPDVCVLDPVSLAAQDRQLADRLSLLDADLDSSRTILLAPPGHPSEGRAGVELTKPLRTDVLREAVAALAAGIRR